jgi:hypothetical protein
MLRRVFELRRNLLRQNLFRPQIFIFDDRDRRHAGRFRLALELGERDSAHITLDAAQRDALTENVD